jgi:RNA polymerase sigma-70 factor (ECF subfamily)
MLPAHVSVPHRAQSRYRAPVAQLGAVPGSRRRCRSDDVHDPAPDPESGLAREQAAGRLRRAIHRLPLVYRQVIMLALEDMGYAEIAEVLGISESNVGARLTRARQLLRESLEKRK